MFLSSVPLHMSSGKKLSSVFKKLWVFHLLLTLKLRLGLVNKKQLGILCLLAQLYIYKSLVNNTPLNFTGFLTFFKNKNTKKTTYLSTISLSDQKCKKNWSLLSLLVQRI